MSLERRLGRQAGVLLFAQLVFLILPFVLVMPLVGDAWVGRAAAAAGSVRTGVLLLFGTAGLTLWLTLVAVPVFRHQRESLALLFLVTAVVFVVLQVIDNTRLLAMLSLSERGTSEGVALAVSVTRRMGHIAALLVLDAWLFLFYLIQYRFTLVPRWLAGLGLLTVLLHFIGVPLMGLFDRPGIGMLAPSLALSHLTVGGWLVGKGWREELSGRTAPPTPPAPSPS